MPLYIYTAAGSATGATASVYSQPFSWSGEDEYVCPFVHFLCRVSVGSLRKGEVGGLWCLCGAGTIWHDTSTSTRREGEFG